MKILKIFLEIQKKGFKNLFLQLLNDFAFNKKTYIKK